MPGVPSSRGCEACRKQKKRCDAPSIAVTTKLPAAAAGKKCSRCSRLGIACVGAGQQRYKFLNTAKPCAESIATEKPSAACPQQQQQKEACRAPPPRPAAPPCNALTALTALFATSVDPTADICVQLPWSFGDFLLEIPARLGRNAALDAASDALAAAYVSFRRDDGGQRVSREALVKHTRAIAALRGCLGDLECAGEAETLCAIMLLLINQVFIGVDDGNVVRHSRGAVQILKARGCCRPRSKFEAKVLLSLRGPVVFEALFDRSIELTEQEWKDLVESEFDNENPLGNLMVCLSRVPRLMRRGRMAMTGDADWAEEEILHVHMETCEVKLKAELMLTHIRKSFDEASDTLATKGRGVNNRNWLIHAFYTRAYGLGLTILVILNCIIIALESCDDSDIAQESATYAAEILKLAQLSLAHRPLGSLYMKLCLGAAWVGTEDTKTRMAVQQALMDLEEGFSKSNGKLSVSRLEECTRALKLQS